MYILLDAHKGSVARFLTVKRHSLCSVRGSCNILQPCSEIALVDIMHNVIVATVILISCCNDFCVHNYSKYRAIMIIVSPHLVIEAVRNWMQQDVSRNTIQRVVFSSKANCTLVEQIMRNSFPLYPKASCRDSGISYTDVQSNESGTESQNEVEHIPNGTEPFQNGFVSVKKRIESLQGRVGESNEIHRCSQADRGRLKKDDNSGLFTNEHRNSKFVEYARKTLDPNLGESLSYVSRFHQSIPSLPLDPPMTLAVSHVYKSLEFLNERGDPIFSPKLRLSISSTASGDLVLNPDRTESEV